MSKSGHCTHGTPLDVVCGWCETIERLDRIIELLESRQLPDAPLIAVHSDIDPQVLAQAVRTEMLRTGKHRDGSGGGVFGG